MTDKDVVCQPILPGFRRGLYHPTTRGPMARDGYPSLSSSRFSEACAPEPKRIRDHGNGAEAHCRRGKDGAKKQTEKRVENARGDRNAYRVIGKREEKILSDVAHGRLAQLAGAKNSLKVALDECDAATFHCDIGAGAHGDAHIGLCESGSVVHPITCHGDYSSLLLQLLDHFRLPLGQHLRFEFGDAQFLGDLCSDAFAIPSEHYDAKALSLEVADGRRRGSFGLILNPNVSRIFSIHRNAESSIVISRNVVDIRRLDRSDLHHQSGSTYRNLVSVDHAEDALSGDGFDLLRRSKLQIAPSRFLHDRVSQGVLAGPFQAGGKSKHLRILLKILRDAHHPRPAFRERAGFVDYEGVDFLQ